MAVDQLPGRVREFATYLNGLTARLDQGGGWCAVFWQRDPDGMQACLEGREVPPWDVVEALLQDLATEHGPDVAAPEVERARALHAEALVAYDTRPGGRDALGDRLDVMLREQRYAAERQAQLGHLLASAATREAADAIRLDLAWARDDHERATARCAELRSRMQKVDHRSAEGQAQAIRRGRIGDVFRAEGDQGFRAEGDHGFRAGGGDGFRAGGGPGAGETRQEGEHPASLARRRETRSAAEATGRGEGARQGWDEGARQAWGEGAEQAWGDGSRQARVEGARQAWDEGAEQARVEGARQAEGAGNGDRRGGGPTVGAQGYPEGVDGPEWAEAPREHGALDFGPAVVVDTDGPHADAAPAQGAATPQAAPAPRPTPAAEPAPKQRKRRRGGARYAGVAEEEAAPVVVPPTVVPTLPQPAAPGRRTPRGARFAGAADRSAERTGPQVETWDAAAGREVAQTVEVLVGLRAQGRSGEAHALLVEAAYWPAARFPLLAAELQRAGLGHDWATLLWEAASLPAERLVAAADALAEAGRGGDGEQMLRQGVARPAGEIGEAVMGLVAEGRHREVRALLDAYVRVRTPEEAARSAAPGPQTLVPLLREAARGVSDERHWDLVHALRVAGHTV